MFFRSRPQLPILAKVEHRLPAPLFYETAIGGHERVILADGSSVILNTNSRVNVDFSGNRRDIHLVRGEAFFEVVHETKRGPPLLRESPRSRPGHVATDSPYTARLSR